MKIIKSKEKETIFPPENIEDLIIDSTIAVPDRGETIVFNPILWDIKFGDEQPYKEWVGIFRNQSGDLMYIPPQSTLVRGVVKPRELRNSNAYRVMFNGNTPYYNSRGIIVLPNLDSERLYTPRFRQGALFLKELKRNGGLILPKIGETFTIRSIPRAYLERYF